MFGPWGMMGMPMHMPIMHPTPGVVPGMPGMGWYNSLPGRFGRDILGRDFAGPGGVGSSQPYRPPDPAALPPMPFGLPFIARPGQEGFDQYGRMIPPEVPEGWDGWGRPLASTNINPPQPPPPPAGPAEGVQEEGDFEGAPPMTGTIGRLPSGTPMTSSSSSGMGRPQQPSWFDRPPAPGDSYFRYADFEPFSLPAPALNHPWELHLPREFVGHDVSEEAWGRFIDDLAKESMSRATHQWAEGGRNRGVLGRGPSPVLTDGVHNLLASWAVAFFSPRGIKIYAAQDGQRVMPPPVDPSSTRRGYSRPDEYSDEDSELSDSYERSDGWIEEESRARRDDAYLPRREREVRRDERARMRRRQRRMRMDHEMEDVGGRIRGMRGKERGEWEVHFFAATPTIWVPGARPTTYGEPKVRLRR